MVVTVSPQPLTLFDETPRPGATTPIAATGSRIAYHLVTLGCPKNVVDSESLEVLLRRGGHVPADRPSAADLIVVNTCGFIDAAKEESINRVLELAAAKRPGQQLVVAGCLTQLYGDELAREVSEIDHIFGVEQWQEIAALAAGGERVPFDVPVTGSAGPRRISAYLKISDGCDRPCTFCIIPTIKGRMRSTPAEELCGRARELVAEGAREIVLVAQDSTAYGEDVRQPDSLADLLPQLSQAVPGAWLRLMYAYPGRVTERLIASMAETPGVVPYLDMPLQHGSVAVLRRMRRPSNLGMVYRTLERLRSAMPQVAIRTSLIVGFPGESDAEFQELLDFVRTARFDKLGVFTYSPQERTPAAAMEGQISETEKRARRAAVLELQQTISLEKHQALVGTEMDVLVEREARVSRHPGRPGARIPAAVGRSHRDAPEVDGTVLVRGVRARPGDILCVRITEALPYDLIAKPV